MKKTKGLKIIFASIIALFVVAVICLIVSNYKKTMISSMNSIQMINTYAKDNKDILLLTFVTTRIIMFERWSKLGIVMK
jgi:hypothetical protein